jgi:uncharacterized protein (DUF433 family)
MIEPRIINRGRGPEIEGTRITVYDILDYHLDGWHRDMIAVNFRISSAQVETALRYIDEHRDEVMAKYQKMLERDAQGNPPELQAKLDALRGTARARLQELRAANEREARDAGHSGGH